MVKEKCNHCLGTGHEDKGGDIGFCSYCKGYAVIDKELNGRLNE